MKGQPSPKPLSQQQKKEIKLKAAAAAKELMRRRATRADAIDSFPNFVRYTFKGYSENWHHKIMAETLEKVIQHAPGYNRVIFEMPPRHGKSELVSRRLPAAYLGRHPNGQVVHATYNSTLAKKEGLHVQRIMSSPAYRQLYPNVKLPEPTRGNTGEARWVRKDDYFEVVGHGGTYSAAGIGGTLTGTGMTLGIIDDPIKNSKEADSETIREAHWDWYLSTFVSREEGEHAAIVISMTRWHEDDLVGRILASAAEAGEKWLVIRFEAIREDMKDKADPRKKGDALWPAKFSKEWMQQRKLRYGRSRSRWWHALYQQRPTAVEGTIFLRDYWGWYSPGAKDKPDYIMTVQSWDTAHGNKKTNAYSTCGTFKVFRGDDGVPRAHLMDVWRGKVLFPELKREAIRKKKKYNPETVLVEAKASGKDLIPELVEVFGKKTIEPIEPVSDKVKRAQDEVDQVEEKRLLLPDDEQPWVQDYVDELAGFPSATYADQVDMTTQFLKWLRSYFKQPQETVIVHRGRKPQMED